tara:strand:- start:94 stop:933 length:840 start_codon:yes stop_codon:yes gene_type:complete
MKLSIIIIHYKNKQRLTTCLNSINKIELNKEIIIIDNNSNDNIEDSLKTYNNVIYIQNKTNLGFSRGCNQGVKIAQGSHLLFLNPDTIVPENTLQMCLNFYSETTNIGLLGVKMLNENGIFLKESARGMPDPLTSLFKLCKINMMFPKSKIFNKYYLGHLDKTKNQEIKIVAGAFMMVSKNIINEINGFDEKFFLFGEDIDISIRTSKKGYKNYYLAETYITHIKGESMKKNWKYIFHFYNSMMIFIKKYYFALIFIAWPVVYTMMFLHYIKYFLFNKN